MYDFANIAFIVYCSKAKDYCSRPMCSYVHQTAIIDCHILNSRLHQTYRLMFGSEKCFAAREGVEPTSQVHRKTDLTD